MKGIVTLCGSTRFKDTFLLVNAELTMKDYIVLSVGSFHNADSGSIIDKDKIIANKEMLDRLHKEKIAISQIVVILNIDGYIGDSTKSELKYARKLDKQVYWYNIDFAYKFNVNDFELQPIPELDGIYSELIK